MTDTLQPLILDLVEWIAHEPRPYAEVMDAWRTSLPAAAGVGGCGRSRPGGAHRRPPGAVRS